MLKLVEASDDQTHPCLEVRPRWAVSHREEMYILLIS